MEANDLNKRQPGKLKSSAFTSRYGPNEDFLDGKRSFMTLMA